MSKKLILACLPLLIIFVIYNTYESPVSYDLNWENKYHHNEINNYFENSLNSSNIDIVTPMNYKRDNIALTDNFLPYDFNEQVSNIQYGITMTDGSKDATMYDTILLNYLKHNGIIEIEKFYSVYSRDIPLSYYVYYRENNQGKLFYTCTLHQVFVSRLSNDLCDLCCIDDKYFKYLLVEQKEKSTTFVRTKIQNY